MDWIKVQKKILDKLAKSEAYYVGEYENREVYVSGHVAWLIPKSQLLLTKERRKDSEGFIDAITGKWTKDATLVNQYCHVDEDKRTREYFASSDGVAVCVDREDRKMFQGCQFYAIADNMPLSCWENNELCGIVMPVKTNNDMIMEGLKNDRN